MRRFVVRLRVPRGTFFDAPDLEETEVNIVADSQSAAEAEVNRVVSASHRFAERGFAVLFTHDAYDPPLESFLRYHCPPPCAHGFERGKDGAYCPACSLDGVRSDRERDGYG